MIERDPKIDPRPGDVLRKGKYERRVISFGFWGGWPEAVHYRNTRRGPPQSVCRTLDGWRRWAKGAEVLVRGQEGNRGTSPRRYGVLPNETLGLPCCLWAIMRPDGTLVPTCGGIHGFTPALFSNQKRARAVAHNCQQLNPDYRVVRVRLEMLQ